MGHRGRAVLQQFYQKTFRKKRYQTNSETKANQNEKLEIISYSQRIKKEKEPLISQQTPKPKGTKVLIKIYHEKFKFQILPVTFRYLLDICF